MMGLDVSGVFEVGDGAGDFDDFEDSAGGKFQFLASGFEQSL